MGKRPIEVVDLTADEDKKKVVNIPWIAKKTKLANERRKVIVHSSLVRELIKDEEWYEKTELLFQSAYEVKDNK